VTDREWPELVPFNGTARASVPPFPVEALPTIVRRHVEGLAGEFLAPVDMPATMAIGALSAAIAGRVRIRLDRGWFEPTNAYLLSVAEPSTHKSPILARVFAAFEDEERDLVERWTQTEKAHAEEREVLSVEIGHLKRRKPDEANKARLRELLAERAKHEPSPRPRLIADDITSERLGVQMAESGPLAIVSAEARAFEMMAGLYRKAGESDIDLYLKAFSGEPIRVARLSRADIFIARPCLTLVLCVQPAAVAKLASREEFRGRGLTARFLTSYPHSNVGHRDWSQRTIADDAHAARFNTRLRQLLSLARPGDDEPTPAIGLSKDAADVFAAYRADVELAMARDRRLEDARDFGGKLPGHCARIAAALHMAENGVDDRLSGETMRRAVAIAEYFAAHTLATWDACMSESAAAKVAAWLVRTRPVSTRTRSVHKALWRVFKEAQHARAACIELCERGYLARADEDDVWLVSPLVLAMSTVSTRPREATHTQERMQEGEEEEVDSVDSSSSYPSSAEKTAANGVHAPTGTRVDPVDSSDWSSVAEVAQ
jgi:hypothetical protein